LQYATANPTPASRTAARIASPSATVPTVGFSAMMCFPAAASSTMAYG
jgi:hypothetical protein